MSKKAFLTLFLAFSLKIAPKWTGVSLLPVWGSDRVRG